MNQKKGFLSLLTAGFIFGTFGIWIRILNQELTTFQQLIFRQLTSLVLIIFLTRVIKQKWHLKGNKIKLLFFSLTFPLLAVCFVLAMTHTKISVAIFSFYATTLISSLLIGFFFFKEKITFQKLTAFSLLFIGLGFFVFPFSEITLNLGFYSALVGGFLCTINNSFKKFFKNKIDRWVLLAVQMLGGLVTISVLMLFQNESFFPPISLTIFLVIIVLGFLLTFAQFLSFIGFQNMDLNIGTIVSASEMIFASFFAALIFKEYPNMNEIVGSGFILLGIILPNLFMKNNLGILANSVQLHGFGKRLKDEKY